MDLKVEVSFSLEFRDFWDEYLLIMKVKFKLPGKVFKKTLTAYPGGSEDFQYFKTFLNDEKAIKEKAIGMIKEYIAKDNKKENKESLIKEIEQLANSKKMVINVKI
jgi:hypothetical protein